MRRPRTLDGLRVLVTRPQPDAQRLVVELQARGAVPILLPSIKILPPDNPHELRQALARLDAYDWIVFTSARGVDAVFDVVPECQGRLVSKAIAVVGSGTARRAQSHGLPVAFVPSDYLTETLAKELPNVPERRILLLRAQVSNPALPTILRNRGAHVEDVAAYRTVPENGESSLVAEIVASPPDWILFTSPSTVEGVCARFDSRSLGVLRAKARTGTIGPVTTQAAIRRGFRVAAEANPHTIDGLVRALENVTLHA